MSKRVVDALREARLSRRSECYRWLWHRYEMLTPLLSGPRAPWKALAEQMSEALSAPVSPQNVMATWKTRVEPDKRRAGIAVSVKRETVNVGERGRDTNGQPSLAYGAKPKARKSIWDE